MRCDRHDLACGPDGRCILCRRGSAPGDGPLPIVALIAILLSVAAGAVAYRLRGDARPLAATAAVPPSPPLEERPAVVSAADPPRSNALQDEKMLALQEAIASARAAHGARPAPPNPPSEDAPPAATPEPLDPAAVAPPSLSEVEVIVYTTAWCPVCKKAKAWMAQNGIRYEERDIEASSDYARKIRLINPRASIPTFDVEGDVMVGFSDRELTAMLQRAARHRAERRTL